MKNSSAILEIKTKNLIHNYNYLNTKVKNCFTGATIKANAYGLGYREVYKILSKNGCKHFFVATFEEAEKIREINKSNNLYVLNGIEANQIKKCIKQKIIPIINSYEDANKFQKILKKLNKKLNIGLHIDTGINRLGINDKISEFNNLKNLKIFIILSHLASGDETKNKYNRIQKNKFNNQLKKLKKITLNSLSNSLGILLGEKYHFDIVRPGIALYGGHYNNKILKKNIRPVVKLKAKILQIKRINKNEYVGYNQTYKTSKQITIAILGIGYADGISRLLSNKGMVFYKNIKFEIIGRVSMDSITINITKYEKMLKQGNYMELLNEKFDIEKLAKNCQTISNEILTSLSNRVKRIYI